MNIRKGDTWALITARGGSKSIPLKNLAQLNGRSLIDYSIRSGQNSKYVSRIVCSTDDKQIAVFCEERNVMVQDRPKRLAEDDVSSLDVILYFLETVHSEESILPEYLVLLEPTSPFVLPEHIDGCIELLQSDTAADSAQTITQVLHVSHAFNQRYLDENGAHFYFKHEHAKMFSKQKKPKFYIHGNVRVMRVQSVLEKREIFGDRSLPMIIPRTYSLDVDGPEDLIWAECFISCGLVKLPE